MTQPGTLGTVVTFTGTNFGDNAQNIGVVMDGRPCSGVTLVTPHTSFNCTAPYGTGQGLITVVTVGGLGGSGTFQFQPPVITSIPSITTAGGLLSITGNQFGNDTSTVFVIVGDKQCGNIVITSPSTGLTCTLPSGVGANLTVTITVNTQPANFLFSFLAPTVTSISPASTSGGLVTIKGTNLGPSATAVAVTVNAQPCTNAMSTSDTQMTCTVVPGTGVNITTVVTVANQNTNALYNYAASVIQYVSPPAGGVVYLVVGNNFGSDPTLVTAFIDNYNCPVINVVTPHLSFNCTHTQSIGASSSVSVTVNRQTSTATVLYSVPVISSATPIPTSGGTILISGTKFGSDINAVSVLVNNLPCLSLSMPTPDSQLACVYTSGTGAKLNIDVTVSSVSANANVFSYLPPAITSVSNPDTRGGVVTIADTNFGNITTGVTITLGGQTCTLQTISHTQINCTVASGTGSGIVLLSINGQPTSLNYMYSAPVVYSVTNSSTAGGVIIIEGDQFGSDASTVHVLIAGQQCTGLSITFTQINCTVGQGIGSSLPLTVTVSGQPATYTFSYSAPQSTSSGDRGSCSESRWEVSEGA